MRYGAYSSEGGPAKWLKIKNLEIIWVNSNQVVGGSNPSGRVKFTEKCLDRKAVQSAHWL